MANSDPLYCSRGRVPMVRLSLERQACVRNRGEKMQSPSAIAAYVGKMWGCRPQEHVVALYFDTQSKLIAVHEVATGGIATAPMDPKVLFAGALTAGAVGLILVHNHPSGDVTPSKQDVALTQAVADGCRLLTIQFLDHLIVGKGGAYYSFLESGQMPK